MSDYTGIQLDGFPRTYSQALYLSQKGKRDGTPENSVNICFLGPPAAGKGTQANKIEEQWGIPHISSGAALRSLKDRELPPKGETPGNYIDKGNRVPDYMMLKVMDEILYETVGEEQSLSRMDIDEDYINSLEKKSPTDFAAEDDFLDLVIYLEVDYDNIIERVTKRRICEKCEESYHLEFKPPSEDGKCDKDECGGKLIQRADDTKEKVKDRIKDFEDNTKPLRRYYDNKDLLVKVDGDPEIEVVTEELFAVLKEWFPQLE